MKVIKVSLFLIVLVALAASLDSCRPIRSYEKTRHPSAPDYTSEACWIALPWRNDNGDLVPSGCGPQNQENAKVDVFYIHPTVFNKGSTWNADLKSKKINKKADLCVKLQATVFNNSARVFAPRYRQAVLKSFVDDIAGREPLALAYEDIKTAFEYYMKHWNNGRPVIIAGHSQGARHAITLLKEYFDGKELQKKLVVAYPVGIPFKSDELKSIPIATSENQTGCYVTWNTFAWNSRIDVRKNIYDGTPCANPLTMKVDTSYAPASLNKGGVSFRRFLVDENVCDAKVVGHVVWIHKPKKKGYFKLSTSYHLWDYSLFYMNIRENALLRTEEYLKRK